MLTPVANRFFALFSAALLLACFVPDGRASSPKGGSLVVRTNDGRKQFILSADAIWQLNVKTRFDASALAFHQGKLLTVNDRSSELFEIIPGTNGVAEVKPTQLFPRRALVQAYPAAQRFDCEGIAVDSSGNLYLCEESQRLVFRSSPDGEVTAHKIDWTPLRRYFTAGVNASFEGIAIGGGRLYLANERSAARLIVVDPVSWTLLDSFYIESDGFALGGPHYSDLSFYGEHLYVLDRNHRVIYKVDPEKKRVLAEYNFAQMELDQEVGYMNDYPTGAMEGLAIDKDHFWLVTDNNGKGRFKYPNDFRPTLFRCKRPVELTGK